jgi:hypothetical protein
LAAWTADHIESLSKAEPAMPVEDRVADTWEPLIAIADAAGGHWPQIARGASKALLDAADTADEDKSEAVKLLVDVREVFADNGVSFLPSKELVAALRSIEQSPWEDFELTPHKLAYRLKDFGIKPRQNTGRTARGYSIEALSDAFARYIRPESSKPSETPSDEQQQLDTSEPLDGSNRHGQSNRPAEATGQTLFSDGWTVPDASRIENGYAPVRDGLRSSLCPECKRAPARRDTRLCDLWTAKQRA